MNIKLEDVEEFQENYKPAYSEMPDMEKLAKAYEILVKNKLIKGQVTADYYSLYIADYPEKGIPEEDLKKLLDLGFTVDEDYYCIALSIN